MRNPHEERQQEYASKIVLIIVFSGMFVWFILGIRKEVIEGFRVGWLEAVLLGLAVMRTGRMIAYDRITEPLRLPFTHTVWDQSGAGKTVIARGVGITRSLGQMISCPICVGTWIAAGLVYALAVFPAPVWILVVILGVTGLAELLQALVEAFTWQGVYYRTEAGARLRQRSKPEEEKVPPDSPEN